MRIECPGCASVYQVPETLCVPGRKLRCANCGHDWRPAGAVPAPENADMDMGEAGKPAKPAKLPDPAERIPFAADTTSSQSPEPRRRAVLAAWAGSVLVLSIAGGSAIAWRQPVMKAWPPSARLFAALRLD